MKIEFDEFCMRQFKPGFTGTCLDGIDKDAILELINLKYQNKDFIWVKDTTFLDGGAEFCKYLVFKNEIPLIKQAVLPITLDLYPFIRSDYFARVATELPVLTRFAQLPPGFNLPVAEYISVILYSRAQIKLEFDAKYNKAQNIPSFYLSEDCEYGIVAILGTINPEPEPMVPITIMRNALGMEEGGNGTKLDKIEYQKSVEFWKNHILVKN
jgi:hypothetical protein